MSQFVNSRIYPKVSFCAASIISILNSFAQVSTLIRFRNSGLNISSPATLNIRLSIHDTILGKIHFPVFSAPANTASLSDSNSPRWAQLIRKLIILMNRTYSMVVIIKGTSFRKCSVVVFVSACKRSCFRNVYKCLYYNHPKLIGVSAS